MTGYGPPDDSSEGPTGPIDFGEQGREQQAPRTPWYRKPLVLIAIAAIVIALIVFAIVELSGGGGAPPHTRRR